MRNFYAVIDIKNQFRVQIFKANTEGAALVQAKIDCPEGKVIRVFVGKDAEVLSLARALQLANLRLFEENKIIEQLQCDARLV